MLRSTRSHAQTAQLRWVENRTQDRGIWMGGPWELRVASPHPHPPVCRLEAEFDEQPARLCYSFCSILCPFALGWGSPLQRPESGDE
ncbi:hypothetical protein L207DRAFT_516095 [Hyaloscypha variabilis F]|uniref:Uncharacterized protein n=1 Tax=Hyaloscypha variabilis (strain UAMH 11265 / GT02V1 / F) TaxID=1149755 RepID=A0A2J6R9H5_HYAVF|nr:hypothetical protein L207DRAFT_516095 [Hyaloscypha variabilis F]